MTIVKLYPASIVDNFEHGTTDLWSVEDNGNGTSALYQTTGKYVKSGEYSLRFGINIGGTPSGWHDITRTNGTFSSPEDWSAYDEICLWLYSSSTSTPALQFRLRNEDTWTEVALSTEVNGEWALVNGDISAVTRDSVNEFQFRVYESSYGSSEVVNFYLDTICLIDTDNAVDLLNSHEFITEQELYSATEVLFDDGIKPSFDFGFRARPISVTGFFPTESSSDAFEKEGALEDLLMGKNQYFFESEAVSLPVKVRSYTAEFETGNINVINYTILMLEDFGIVIPR
jgi:hypothetical protein